MRNLPGLRCALVAILAASSPLAADVSVTSFTIASADGAAYGFGPVENGDGSEFALELSGAVLNVSVDDFEVLDAGFNVLEGGPEATGITGSGASYGVTLSRNGYEGLLYLQVRTGTDIAPVGGGVFNPSIAQPPSVLFTGGRPYLALWQEIDPSTGDPYPEGAFPTWGNFGYHRLTFSEAVQAFDKTDFQVNWIGLPPEGEISSISGGSTSYDLTLDANGNTGMIETILGPTQNVASVATGRPLLTGSFGIYGPQTQLNGGPPTGTVSAIPSPRTAMPTEVVLSFDEPVQDLDISDVTLAHDDGAGTVTPIDFTGTLVDIGDQRNYQIQ